jgi:hypothetical protein
MMTSRLRAGPSHRPEFAPVDAQHHGADEVVVQLRAVRIQHDGELPLGAGNAAGCDLDGHTALDDAQQSGLYYTLADGLKWQRAEARGLRAKVNALAVPPADAKVVAAGADDGLHLSRDFAASFTPLVSGTRGARADL